MRGPMLEASCTAWNAIPRRLTYLDRAQSIFEDNANVHFLRALVLQQMGRAADAEAEFRSSLNLEPNDETWFDLGLFYMTQKRYADAAEIFRQSAESSSRPHEMWMMLGQAELQMQAARSCARGVRQSGEQQARSAKGVNRSVLVQFADRNRPRKSLVSAG